MNIEMNLPPCKRLFVECQELLRQKTNKNLLKDCVIFIKDLNQNLATKFASFVQQQEPHKVCFLSFFIQQSGSLFF